MSARKRKRKSRKGAPSQRGTSHRKTALRVQWIEDCHGWELVHPRCVRKRAEDIEEVELMIGAGEFDVATDELRWLLEDCSDFIDAHRLLGEIALEGEDWPLARAHLGYCYDIGSAAMNAAGAVGPLSQNLSSNRGLLLATYLFAGVLYRLDKRKTAKSVLRRLLEWDPKDPLGATELLIAIQQPPYPTSPDSDLPLVELKPVERQKRNDNREPPGE